MNAPQTNPTPACLPTSPCHVYVALRTNSCFLPLHQWVAYGAYRMSLCALSTYDRLQHVHRLHLKATARPRTRPFFAWKCSGLYGTTDQGQNKDRLRIYLSDRSNPPHTYTNDIVEWLHETVQLQLHPLTAVQLHPLTAVLPEPSFSTLGIFSPSLMNSPDFLPSQPPSSTHP